jgi:cytochrome c-type biogenesis protein CcmH
MRRKILLAAAVIFIFSLPAVHSVQAQQPTPSEDQVNALAKEMYCPVCENTPLDVCPTKACAQWRDLIRQKMELGWSNKQIKDYFAEQYGEQVLSEPPISGQNRWIYFAPPLFLLLASIVLFRVLKSSRKLHKSVEAQGEKPAESSAEDPYLARAEEELARYKKG